MFDASIKLIPDDADSGVPATVFEGFFGQPAAKAKLKFFLEGYGADMPIFPTLMFTGSHGLGKTYLAEKVAKNLNRRFVVINSATIESDKDFVERIMVGRIAGDKPVTVLLDEAHALKNDVTDVLLTLLAPNKDGKNTLHKENISLEYNMAKVNVILATTDAYSVFPALVNRAERIYFEAYTLEELLAMLRYYLPHVVFECNVRDLAYACRGRGRDAYKLAENIKRFCAIHRCKVMGEDNWSELKKILEIYPLGLNKQEVQVLRIIGEKQPIAASGLAAAMMISEASLTAELETRLRELQLITTSSRGRELTDDGKKYLEKL